MVVTLLPFTALVGFAAAFSIPNLWQAHGKRVNTPEPIHGSPPTLPPLKSPPHPTNQKLKPKKFIHVWTGSANKRYKDFLASYSIDDDTFGTLLNIADIPSGGNEPHHSGPSADGKTIWGGGLLSILRAQDTGYYFNLSKDVRRPVYWKSDRAVFSSVADDVNAKPGGGFFYTYMGSSAGESPGRVVETDENYNIIHEWPEDPAGLEIAASRQFTPHGLAIDFERGIMLDSDYVVPASAIKPSMHVQGGHTVTQWYLPNRTISNTHVIPNGGGMQDVKFIPGNEEAAALTCAVGLGQIWIIYPMRKGKDGKPGTTELFFDLGPLAKDTVAIYSTISQRTKEGKQFAYFSYTTGNHVAQLDISDLKNPKRLDNPKVKQPLLGPHFLKVTPDQKHLIVVDYFLQVGKLGIINTPSDYRVQYADINDDGSVTWDRYIPVYQEFPERGGAKPHSFSVYDYSNPKDPMWL